MTDYSLTSLPAVAERTEVQSLGPDTGPRIFVSGPSLS